MLNNQILCALLLCYVVNTSCYRDHGDWWDTNGSSEIPCRVEDGYMLCYKNELNNTEICVKKTQARRYCRLPFNITCNDDEYPIKNQCWTKYINFTKNVTEIIAMGVRDVVQRYQMYRQCRNNEFKCQSVEICIPRSMVQDRSPDCSNQLLVEVGAYDSSDEDTILQCNEKMEFHCNDTESRCIPREWIRDGTPDCRNGVDERTSLACSNDTEFLCAENKRCILRYRVNDGFSDCRDGADENVPNFACLDLFEFACPYEQNKTEQIRRCIPRKWVGNNVIDCRSGEDETTNLSKCLQTEFACLDKSRCLSTEYLCDGNPNCSDGSDEIELCSVPTMYRSPGNQLIPWSFLIASSLADIHFYFPNFQPKYDLMFGIKCIVPVLNIDNVRGLPTTTNSLRAIPQLYIMKKIPVCLKREDYCFDKERNFLCGRCLDGTIILKRQICDGVIDCRDLSDECPCQESPVAVLCEKVLSLEYNSQGTYVELGTICNGTEDMNEGIDEKFCNRRVLEFDDYDETSAGFQCNFEHLSNKSLSVYKHNVKYCDGHVDCPKKEDECSTSCIIKDISMIYRKLVTCYPYLGWLAGDYKYESDWRFLFPYYSNRSMWDDSRLLKLNSRAYRKMTRKYKMETICEYKLDYSGVLVQDDQFLTKFSGSLTNINRFNKVEKICPNLTDTKIDACSLNAFACPWLHKCISYNDTVKYLELTKCCDSVYDCKDKSDETNCSNHFYCHGGEPFFISKTRVLDGYVDCLDCSDEYIKTPFASATEMIHSVVLRAFICIISICIIISNGVVMLQHIQKIRKVHSKKTVPFCNTLLLINLTCSDMLFGLTLLVIGIKSLQFSGKYCGFDIEWRTSSACNIIGIFTVISSQTSINILLLMTALRFYITYWPFMSNRIHVNRLILLCICSWAIPIGIAIVPILGSNKFIHHFNIEQNWFFIDILPDRRSLENYVTKTNTICSLTNCSSTPILNSTDSFVIDTLRNWYFNSKNSTSQYPNRHVDVKAQFGFYSSSSVCIADFYSQTSPASEYALALILYNFFALILILVGYFFIFKKIRKSKQKTQGTQNRALDKTTNKTLKRISFIILTDILCWLPIIGMSIVSYSGYSLPNTAHAISAIFFLPINSLINPIIYSRLDQPIWRKLKACFRLICTKCQRKEPVNNPRVEIEMEELTDRTNETRAEYSHSQI